MLKNSEKTMEKSRCSYAKAEDISLQALEIYGGLSNSWDYGPLGSRIQK